MVFLTNFGLICSYLKITIQHESFHVSQNDCIFSCLSYFPFFVFQFVWDDLSGWQSKDGGDGIDHPSDVKDEISFDINPNAGGPNDPGHQIPESHKPTPKEQAKDADKSNYQVTAKISTAESAVSEDAYHWDDSVTFLSWSTFYIPDASRHTFTQEPFDMIYVET